MIKKNITIAGREIGEGQPPYIIAELSANHNGSIDRALQSISMAAQMGADAVKIQTYTPDTMTIKSDKDDFIIKGGLWDGYTLYDLYAKAYTPYEWHARLFEHAKKEGITLFSSPFDETAVELLEGLHAPAYKIASFELLDLPLIQRVAKTGKPMIMSTGMADKSEIEEAVVAATAAGCTELVLLHCISGYPAPVEQSNLQTIPAIKQIFNTVVGLSDHTLGTAVSVASVVLGASVIEKHFTLSRDDKGPDSEFSLEPQELKALCDDTKAAWQAMGIAGFERKAAEKENVKFRRSLYVVKDIKKGERLSHEHIRRIRPGFGLAPKYLEQVIGKIVVDDIEKGTPLTWQCLQD
ncbi:MAG: N-acetylneuraminate synthase [Pseudohongiellaceae bacterium]|jgi:N-acetylneuraminate synthase